jgi:hypothetical protein
MSYYERVSAAIRDGNEESFLKLIEEDIEAGD